MLLYGVDLVCLKAEQVRRISVAFNTVFTRTFHMSQFLSMRLMYYFMGIKTNVSLYHERRINLHSQSCISEFDLFKLL